MTDAGEPSAGAADPPLGADGAVQRARRALNPLAIAGNLEYDRVLFFSDAVMAIAITLLVVDLRVPDVVRTARRELATAEPKILSFGISFVVIGLFWLGHHHLFRYITALDRRLILLNLLFLGTIAFLPYPTQVFGAALRAGHGERTAAVFFNAVCAGTMESSSGRATAVPMPRSKVRRLRYFLVMNIGTVSWFEAVFIVSLRGAKAGIGPS